MSDRSHCYEVYRRNENSLNFNQRSPTDLLTSASADIKVFDFVPDNDLILIGLCF